MTNKEYETVITVRRILAETLGIAPPACAVEIIRANGPYIDVRVRGVGYSICGEELTCIFTDNVMFLPEHYETEEER